MLRPSQPGHILTVLLKYAQFSCLIERVNLEAGAAKPAHTLRAGELEIAGGALTGPMC